MKRHKRPAKGVAIVLKNVTKKYVLHHEKPTFVENLMKMSHQNEFTALNNVSLTVYQGEKIGLFGANGAGKTTLLKIISQITTPTSGKVTTHGKIVSLIDLEAGFHPDLTGEENIFLNGLLIGMTKAQLKEKYQSIVEFADIGEFIDAPLYTYSTGMKLRLGFSVAIHSDPDILVVDEGITTGDLNFQKKTSQKIKSMFDAGKTILLVSHWSHYLVANCDRLIWFDKGSIKMDGDKSVMEAYQKSVQKLQLS